MEGLGIPEVASEAAKRLMTVQDLMSVPEQDGWIYTGLQPRDGEAYVCSSYVISVYKAAGLFDDFDINATEFAPRDVYNMDFFDKNFKRPS